MVSYKPGAHRGREAAARQRTRDSEQRARPRCWDVEKRWLYAVDGFLGAQCLVTKMQVAQIAGHGQLAIARPFRVSSL